MNNMIARIATTLNPVVAIVIALAGAVAGGSIGGGPLGAMVGLVTGIAVATALCGAVALLSSNARATSVTQAQVPLAAGVTRDASANTAPALAAAVAIMPASIAAAAGLTGEAAVAPVITETEAQLLAAGRFSDYHLAKAQRILKEGNFKEAAYQAAASLSHNSDNPVAAALRKTALAAAKG